MDGAPEGECHLTRRRPDLPGDLGQQRPPAVFGPESGMAERAVGDHRRLVLLAPGDNRVLDTPLEQMIEHLVAGDRPSPARFSASSRSLGVEIADPPTEDLAFAPQLVEGCDRLRQRVRAAPMQQVAVEMIGAQPGERALAGVRVPEREALCGRTFDTRKTSSRRPAMASPMNSSAAPEPYISAVSIWSMPRSRPRRKAAIAAARGACSKFQVPIPITATSRPVGPNMRRCMAVLRAAAGLSRVGAISTRQTTSAFRG